MPSIGTNNLDPSKGYGKKHDSGLVSGEFRAAAAFGGADPNLQTNRMVGNEGFNCPEVSFRHGNFGSCENEKNPDTDIPKEMFDFELILNSRKFKVMLDTLIRIKNEEDLANFSDKALMRSLEMCAAYRVTCYCAYIASHREFRKWEAYAEEWLAEKREEARQRIRVDRIADKSSGLRKEIGQITTQELEDWILVKHGLEYHKNKERTEEWKESASIYLELRDTLKDRAMHLQTLLKRVNDQTDPSQVSAGN